MVSVLVTVFLGRANRGNSLTFHGGVNQLPLMVSGNHAGPVDIGEDFQRNDLVGC